MSGRGRACLCVTMVLSAVVIVLGTATSTVQAQDEPKTVDIFLDEERVDVEADIPSVELFLSFRGLHYESIDARKSFLPELFRTVEQAPL